MGDFQPRRPALAAALVFLGAGLILFWPMFTGQFLAGPDSDQFLAGYGFRLFGAEYFRAYGHIPQWNPYLFGGIPFVAAMHGDIFYPTAWLRWIVPTDIGMNIGFAFHIVLAGCTMYAFLRALGVSWGGALVGGISYELSGLVAGLVNPGHDGKLFVASLAPLLLLAILRAVREQRVSSFGLMAIVVGLSLHGHPQLSYYLLVAAFLWGLWLLFLAPDRPPRSRVLPLAAGALVAVALGIGIYAIQALPFIQYIPFSPRASGGPSGGWDYATAYPLPPSELMSLVMPEFNGIREAYWGVNPLKHHTEYIGVIPLALAVLGMGAKRRRPVIVALGAIGLLFLLIAFGAHTPFYRLWYDVMPMMKKVRAPGMAFFLTVLPLSVFAGFGAERLLSGELPFRKAVVPLAVLGGLGVLGVLGVLQAVGQTIAIPERMTDVMANATALRLGGVRVLVLALLGMSAVWAIAQGRLAGASAAAALAVVTVADLWSVERRFFSFQPPVAVSYANDEITTALEKNALPYRVLDAGAYRGSWLMAHHIPTLLGYHGNELRWFDELLGGKNEWRNFSSMNLWRLFGVGHLILGDTVNIPGWHRAVGPTRTTSGIPAYLYSADTMPTWVRVVPAAAKVPEAQIIPTLLDPRFPVDRLVLFPDTTDLKPAAIGDSMPGASPVRATLTGWQPGRMTVGLEGKAAAESYLVVSENWYLDWTATVDGVPTATHRGDYSLITVAIPPGAREVTLEFRSAAYEKGRLITFISLFAALGLWLIPVARRRRSDG